MNQAIRHIERAMGRGDVHSSDDLARLDKFAAFHLTNPQVYAWFKHFAEQLIQHNDSGSARLIGEQIRWKTAVNTLRLEGEPKFNDHLWPYYARLLAAHDNRYEAFFSFRNATFPFTSSEVRQAVERANQEPTS